MPDARGGRAAAAPARPGQPPARRNPPFPAPFPPRPRNGTPIFPDPPAADQPPRETACAIFASRALSNLQNPCKNDFAPLRIDNFYVQRSQ